ncbi:uncharacterized protein LOC135684431 isoform X4 [Rhopilema esculentum]|uniref:uncharacterized protein LOC135684431 isoform X4 n=1 Tax=Rhopilema esculentum TaxID=499914 RepID=UPI0031DD37B6
MGRSVLEIILFCTLAALHGKLSVDGQSFNPAAGTFVDKFGNKSQSIEVTWTYNISSLEGGRILCGFLSDFVIKKEGTAAASLAPEFQGRASAIDDPGQRKIGFQLRNFDFGDAKDVLCTYFASDSTPYYSGFYKLKICDGQSFNPAAGTFVDKFGNKSQSIEVTWTYDISSLESGSILCGFQSDYVVRKKGTAAASLVPKYQGRASAIDDPGQRKIGFQLRNIDFGDAKDVLCTFLASDLTPTYSGIYKIKIYEVPEFRNCLTEGTTSTTGQTIFALQEGQTLNSTCYVYGNPIPKLTCGTYDDKNNQVGQNAEVTGNFTNLPISSRLRFFNVRRGVTKVRCVADGGPTGKKSMEVNVQVDHVATAPVEVRLIESTYTSIRIGWKKPASPGYSAITDYLFELYHPNNTETVRNMTVTGGNPTLEYTFLYLNRDQEYRIRISAYNAVGRGAYAEQSYRTVPKKPEVGGRSGDSMSDGTIVGIVFGVIAAIVLIIIIVFFVLKKRQEKQKYPKSYVEEAVDYPAMDNAMYSRVNKKKPMEVGVNESTSGYPDIIHQAKPVRAEEGAMLPSQDHPQKNAVEKSRKEYV